MMEHLEPMEVDDPSDIAKHVEDAECCQVMMYVDGRAFTMVYGDMGKFHLEVAKELEENPEVAELMLGGMAERFGSDDVMGEIAEMKKTFEQGDSDD